MIGTTLLNRYRIEAQLGQGGMGIVYRANYDRDVAAVRAGLSEADFLRGWAEGRGMTMEQINV